MSSKTIKPGEGFDLENPNLSVDDRPVECLGKTFENDTARRDYYLELLAEKLKDPEFRRIEGFPIGEDEDILELSDPPYYTVCPNPFIEDFVAHYGRPYDPSEGYTREPYAADVSEGKNDPIYNAHSYHTKVPHKAIMRYILHYTNPGDIIFDGFCGTGMTGVAAQMCGDAEAVESLGYRVLPDDSIMEEVIEPESGKKEWTFFSRLGVRRSVLNDLSPAASFIATNYNSPFDSNYFKKESNDILRAISDECNWMYETNHHDGRKGVIHYTVWSDVFVCNECAEEVVFWDAAVDQKNGAVRDEFACLECGASLTKKSMERAWISLYDDRLKKNHKLAKQVPVQINYSVDGVKGRIDKKPNESDLALVDKITKLKVDTWYPIEELPKGDKTSDPFRVGVTHSHYFFTKRNLIVLSRLRHSLRSSSIENQLLCLVGDQLPRASKMHKIAVSRLNTNLSKTAGILAGTLYIPSTQIEYNVLMMIGFRTKDVASYLSKRDGTTRQLVQTGSCDSIKLANDSMDYLFFDPPFGSNLMYSELNFMWESWLGIKTNKQPEAIENKTQGKDIDSYRRLMLSCFSEAFRVLKPGRWMTVEFSNTKASVWNNIQSAITDAGFIVANVSALDKKQGTFNAVSNTTSVKQDLVISAYKANGGFENRFQLESDVDGVWDFVRTHLGYLPVVKKQGENLSKIQERDPRILFDQVVSYFVRNGRDVPLSTKEFQAGLLERFIERDGMIFLEGQVSQYEKTRITSSQLRQISIFVDDEASAIEWLRQLLNDKTQTYQDIHPKFINELSGWKKAEEQPELSTLLEQNFIKYDGIGPLPPQIHSYLSTNFKEFRNLKKTDAQLVKKAKDRWYVPNPEREEDLQKLRERSLLSEFDDYQKHSGKKLKKVRMEAVRCGFKKAWQDRDYTTIIDVAEKIPQGLLQGDQKLLMWYDQAQTRASDESLF